MFGFIDSLVVIFSILVVAGVGIRLGFRQHTTRDYFLGGKNVPWWAVGLSIIATETSAATFIGIPAMAFGVFDIQTIDGVTQISVKSGNIAFIQIIIGYIIARIVLAIIMIPHYFKGEIYSPYQILSRKFGESPCTLSAFLFLLSGTFSAGVRIYITAIPIQVILGVTIFQAILIFTIVAVIYTLFGGIKAVIWTDVIQFFILFGGGLFALFYIPTIIDGGLSHIIEQATALGKFQWFNSGFTGEGFISSIKNIISGPFNIWMGLLGATIGVMYSHGGDQLLVQRILTCKSVKDGRRAMIMSALIILPLMLTFLLVGVWLYIYYQARNWGFEIPPINPDDGKFRTDYVFPVFIVANMPIIIKGFLISAIFAAALSSIDSALSALGSVSVMDFYKKYFRKNATEKHYLNISRISIVFWGIMMILVAWLSRMEVRVLEFAFQITGLFAGPILGALLFAIYTKSRNPTPVLIGMIVSFLTMCFVVFGGRAGLVNINWPWFVLIGTSVNLIVTNILNLLLPKKQ